MASLIGQWSALQYISWAVEALLAMIFWLVMACLPVAWASRCGAFLLAHVGPWLPKHQHMISNLTVVLGDRPATVPGVGISATSTSTSTSTSASAPFDVEQVARACWANFGAVLAEYPHLRTLSRKRVVLEVDPATKDHLDAGRAAVFVSAHLGNWELGGGAIDTVSPNFAAIYSPISNPWVDQVMQWMRRRSCACHYLPRDGALREWLRAGRAGRSLALLADQRVDEAPLVPFFSRPAETTLTPARLALRLNVPIVPFRVRRTAPGRYVVQFEAPLPMSTDGDEGAMALTLALLARFEAWIHESPGDWLCAKRRWPRPPRSARPAPREANA